MCSKLTDSFLWDSASFALFPALLERGISSSTWGALQSGDS